MGAFSRKPRLDPRTIGAFLVMFSLTLASSYATWYFSAREAQAEFRSRVSLIQEAISSRIQSYIDLLGQTRGLIDATPRVTAKEFTTFVRSVKLRENFPGAQGLGYAAKKGAGFPITYLEPPNPENLNAVGFDMYSEPVRHAAMRQAMLTGDAAVTDRVRLVQSAHSGSPAGFLIYVPVYKRGMPTRTPQERERAIQGFAYSAFFSDVFFNSIIRRDIDRDLKVDFEIYSSPVPSPQTLMHDHGAAWIPTRNSHYRALTSLDFVGRRWSIYFHTLPGFRSQFSLAVSWVILVVGSLLSFILTWNFWLLRVRQAAERAQRERLEFLYETTKELVGPLTDPQDVLVRLNRALIDRVADWTVSLSLPDLAGGERSQWRVYARSASLQKKLEEAPLSDFLGMRRTAREAKEDHVELVEARVAPNTSGALEFAARIPLRSYLCVPLRTRTRTLGAVALGISSGRKRFIEEDVTLIRELANRAALAIENAILFRNSEEAVQVRDTFMSIASHELKTPLTTLRLQTQLAQHYLHGSSPERAVPRLEGIVDATDKQVTRLARLVDDMLDVTRIRTGKLELEFTSFDLAGLADETVNRMREQFRSARAEIGRVDLESVVGRWDRFRIEQVMINLLTNALKYGGGKPVEIYLRKKADRASFSVVDRGIGIAPDAKFRIFQRFERAISAKNISGLGLGLYIVREIVEGHGGVIRVDSELGRGSTFTVELPLDPAQPLQVPLRSPGMPGASAS